VALGAGLPCPLRPNWAPLGASGALGFLPQQPHRVEDLACALAEVPFA
jgi:hypothetical protein